MDEENRFISTKILTIMSNWQQLKINERILTLQQAEKQENINALAIEKDWWVTTILKERIIYRLLV